MLKIPFSFQSARLYAMKGFRYVFSSFWHAIAFIAVTIIFGGVIKEVFSGAYTIEFNEVPDTLVKTGLGKVALAVRVRDRVAAMVAQAQADVRLHAAVFETTTLELKIVGTEIPLRYVANEIRNFFGIPLLRISGLILGIIPLTPVQKYANLQIIGDSNDPQAHSSKPSRNQN